MPRRAAKAARPRESSEVDDDVRPSRSARVCPACHRTFEGRGLFCVDCATAAGLAPSL